METTVTTRPTCSRCTSPAIGWGRDRHANKRFRCQACKRTWTVLPVRPLGSMRIPFERALLCLNILTEGGSIRSAERITGTHRDTIGRLLVFVGGKCEKLLASTIQGVKVENLEADELWTYVGMKERQKAKRKITDPRKGDAYCFVGMDRDTKLVLAHHLGRRTGAHTDVFAEKLAAAVSSETRVQISTDGWSAYPEALAYHFGDRADFGTIVKEFGSPGAEELRRYSPPRLIGAEKSVVFGNPEEDRIGTSRVERNNLTFRTNIKRMSRLTCAFSRKWENLNAAISLHVAVYNFTRMHRSIRMTPAMKAGVTRTPWTLAQLVGA